MEIDDPTVTMTIGKLMMLIESYRNLVSVLLDHTALHEGTDNAIADFLISDDRATEILRHIRHAQSGDHEWLQ